MSVFGTRSSTRLVLGRPAQVQRACALGKFFCPRSPVPAWGAAPQLRHVGEGQRDEKVGDRPLEIVAERRSGSPAGVRSTRRPQGSNHTVNLWIGARFDDHRQFAHLLVGQEPGAARTGTVLQAVCPFTPKFGPTVVSLSLGRLAHEFPAPIRAPLCPRRAGVRRGRRAPAPLRARPARRRAAQLDARYRPRRQLAAARNPLSPVPHPLAIAAPTVPVRERQGRPLPGRNRGRRQRRGRGALRGVRRDRERTDPFGNHRHQPG